MSVSKVPNIVLNNGYEMPVLGLGTWQSLEGQVYQAVLDAIDCGYRHFDTAFYYFNEHEIGLALNEAINQNKVKREDLFITTKLWLTYTRPDRVLKAIEKSLSNLKLSYVDLYLIHWPMSFEQQDEEGMPQDSDGMIRGEEVDNIDTWKAMEELVEKGLTKSIGISNFNSQQIERLLKSAKVKPVTNQIEVHPFLAQNKLIDYCSKHNIVITAYAPLGNPGSKDINDEKTKRQIIDNEKVKCLAQKYGKTSSQILIRFSLDRGLVVIPKSVNKLRIQSNIDVFDFQLTKEEVQQLESLNTGYRVYTFDYLGVPELKSYPFAGVEF